MKTTKELLTNKKSHWKIIDSSGNTIAKGFRLQTSAKNEIQKLRIHKSEKLEVVEE